MAKLLAHKLLGIAAAYYVLKPAGLTQAFMYGGLALLGSMLPDLDGLHGHRKTLHNLPACILTGLIVYLALETAAAMAWLPVNTYPAGSATAYILAYLSHLLADIPTGNGVAILYPFTDKRIRVLGLRYDNTVYNGLLIALATLLLYSFFTGAPSPYNLVMGGFAPPWLKQLCIRRLCCMEV